MANELSSGSLRPFPEGPLLRDISDLEDPAVKDEPMRRIESARVVFANYALLQHDFPQLRDASLLRLHPELGQLSSGPRKDALREIIDKWLLRNAAYVSVPQVDQTEVNTPIAVTGNEVLAYRPPLYGRACVTAVAKCREALPAAEKERWAGEDDGLLDVKGVGVPDGITPSPTHHANGLLALGDALTNILFQEVINLIFRRAGTDFWTVPEYGLIDAGFEVKHLFGEGTPAALHVRRAHTRPLGGAELPHPGTPEQQVKVQIEMLLRYYGLTSCNSTTSFEVHERDGHFEVLHAGNPIVHPPEQIERIRRLTRYKGKPLYFDGINVQLTREVAVDPARAQVVDFGHYSVHQRFTNPVLSLVRGRPLRWGGSIRPSNPAFVSEPLPELSLPWEHWGVPSPGDADYRTADGDPTLVWPRPFARCFALADRFRSGEITGREVRADLDLLLATAIDKWDQSA